jgi:hypothetical protein
MVSSGGGDKASGARARCVWGKFRELAPILTSRGTSLTKGKVCIACVMTYGSEIWPMRVEDICRMERAEQMMIGWIYGVTLRNGKLSEEPRNRVGIGSLSDIVRQGRLRWFGPVEHKDAYDCVLACRNMAVQGKVVEVGLEKHGRSERQVT